MKLCQLSYQQHSYVPALPASTYTPASRTPFPCIAPQQPATARQIRLCAVVDVQRVTALSAGPSTSDASTAVHPDNGSSTAATTTATAAAADPLTAGSLSDGVHKQHDEQQQLRDITLQLSDALWGQPSPAKWSNSLAAAQQQRQDQLPSYQQLLSFHIVIQPRTSSDCELNPTLPSITPYTFQQQHQPYTQQLHPLAFSKAALSALTANCLLSKSAWRSGAVAVVLTGPYLPSQLHYLQHLARPNGAEALCCRPLLGPQGLHVVLSTKPWQQQQQVEQEVEQQQQQREDGSKGSEGDAKPPIQPHSWQQFVLSSFGDPEPVTTSQLDHARAVEQALMTQLCLYDKNIWHIKINFLSAKSRADHILSVAAVITANSLNNLLELCSVRYPQGQVFVQQLTSAGLVTLPDTAASAAAAADKLLEVVVVIAHRGYPQAALAAAAAINRLSSSSPILSTKETSTGSSSSSSSSRAGIPQQFISRRSSAAIIPGYRMHVLLGEPLHEVWTAAVARIREYRIQWRQQQQLRLLQQQSGSSSSSNHSGDVGTAVDADSISDSTRGSSNSNNRGRRSFSAKQPAGTNGLIPMTRLPLLLALSGPGLTADEALLLLRQQAIDILHPQTAAGYGTSSLTLNKSNSSSSSSSSTAGSSSGCSMRWQTVYGHSVWKALQGGLTDDKQQSISGIKHPQPPPPPAAAAAAGASNAGGLSIPSRLQSVHLKTMWAYLYGKMLVTGLTTTAAAAAVQQQVLADPTVVTSGRRRRKLKTTVTAAAAAAAGYDDIDNRGINDRTRTDLASSSSSSSGLGSSEVTLLLSWLKLNLPHHHPELGLLQQQRQVRVRWMGKPPPAVTAAPAVPRTSIRVGGKRSRQTTDTPAAEQPYEHRTAAVDDRRNSSSRGVTTGSSIAPHLTAAADDLDDADDSVVSAASFAATAAAADDDDDDDDGDQHEAIRDDLRQLDHCSESLNMLLQHSVNLQIQFTDPATYDRVRVKSGTRKLGHTPLFQQHDK